MSTGRALPGLARGSELLNGAYRITGVVDALGIVGRYLVRLHLRGSGALIAQTVSADDGAYTIERVPNCAMYAVGFDNGPTPQVAACSDQLILERMP